MREARALAVLAALAIALAAQLLLDRGSTGQGLPLAALAALLALLAGGTLPEPAAAAAPSDPPPAPPRRRARLAAAVALALLGAALLEPNRFTAVGTLAWLGGIAGAVLACGVARPPSRPATPAWAWPALAAAVGVGAVLRLHQLADLPAEAGCDIPLKIAIVRGILDGERPIFSTVYPGREVGFFYLTALLGDDQWALKLTSALCSLATLPLVYALGARWFGAATGLWAAAWLALAPWHVTISRIGYRGVLTPLIAALVLLLLDRALARRGRRDFALLGLATGAGLYTYTASAALAAAVAAVGLFDLWRGGRRAAAGWATAVLLAGLAALPLLRFAAADPQNFLQRAASRLEAPAAYDLGPRLLDNARRSLAMFNLRGDVIATQNTSGERLLGPVSGALFLCGAGIAVAGWRQRRCALTLLFLVAAQLPSALVLGFPDEVPGAVRASGALVPAALLCALPLPLAWRQLRALSGRHWAPIAAGAAALLLAWEARATWTRYFERYAAGLPFANYPLTRTIAATIDANAAFGEAWLPDYPYWIDGNAVRTQLRVLPPAAVHAVALEAPAAEVATLPAGALVIVRPDAEEHLARLRAAAPDGELTTARDAAGQPMFLAFRIR